MIAPRTQFPTALHVLCSTAVLMSFWYLFFPASRAQAAMLGGTLALMLWCWLTGRVDVDNLSLQRSHPGQLFEHDAFELSLRVGREDWPPLQMLEIEDRCHVSLETGRRHIVPMLRPGWEAQLHERLVAGRHRGLYLIGPVKTTCGDPLGVFFRNGESDVITRMTVYPCTDALEGYRIPGEAAGPGASLDTQLRSGQGEEIIGVREYTPGDPPQRIHWRTTARRGRLHVKRLNCPVEAELRVSMDLSRRARFGTGAEATTEIAIASAASVLTRGYEARHRLSMGWLNHDEWTEYPAGRGLAHLHLLLEKLAVVLPRGEGDFWISAAPGAMALKAGSRAMFIASSTNTPLVAAAPLVRSLTLRGVAVDIALIDDTNFIKIYSDQERDIRQNGPPFSVVSETLRLSGARVFPLDRENTRLDPLRLAENLGEATL